MHGRFSALTIALCLLLDSCSCNYKGAKGSLEPKHAALPEEMKTCSDDSLDTNDTLIKDISFRCQQENPRKIPLLFARQYYQSNDENSSFMDLLYTAGGSEACAPGPFLVKEDLQQVGQMWHFDWPPQLFVWHQGGTDSPQAQITMIDSRGGQIPTKMMQLREEGQATFVLLPTDALPIGQSLYLYLKIPGPLGLETWVQPFSIRAST